MSILNIMLHDDWELYGDGSGDIKKLMFDKAYRLMEICDKYEAKYTFFAEFGQQLAMRDSNIKEFIDYAKQWDEILIYAIKNGHDVQLHFHPQWINAKCLNGEWKLNYDKWSLSLMEKDDIVFHLKRGIEYLERTLKPHKDNYKIVAFRTGSWMIQPSYNIIRALNELNILADVTVVKGMKLSGKLGNIDFSYAPSPLLPWHPDIHDVAKSGKNNGCNLICFPTYSEEIYIPGIIFEAVFNIFSVSYNIKKKFHDKFHVSKYTPVFMRTKNNEEDDNFYVSRHKILRRIFHKRQITLDYGYYHYRTIYKIILSILEKCEKLGLTDIPLILLSHSKSFYSYKNFEKLLRKISNNEDLSFKTTQEVALKEYPYKY